MFPKILLFILLFFGFETNAQVLYTAEDSTLFYSKLKTFENFETNAHQNIIVAIGKTFLETPYVEKTLELGESESLVVNLRGLDCTTFVENVLAFGLMYENQQFQFLDFIENLEKIRYRDGKINGYPSRLHYFTEWIRNNEKKGLVTDITSELGGIQTEKSINFMGTHRNLYPFLGEEENYKAILEVEETLAKENLCILPQDQIEQNENLIQSGDIVALATSIKGLDVTHTGIAIKQPDERIYLLHASSAGSVMISKEPLVDYLKKIKYNIGIIVARPTLLSP
ncbi:hypothetical protein HME9304_01670 [Flagellimonas maritima]|uniref:DUF1460 domain-containing protein n=1 Tax=Flagellimonas maritima TaxID=1383885 RepID=A0A2Z4LTQ3_9FLAO|nr:N-acetylmuramoyl-L-alanine amidase-like domain-containing protein [Allomuricauda aurantiaca]AWX44667.1 hypothetical protein HME9304_01670 [Allomuricauda aurantiaca]